MWVTMMYITMIVAIVHELAIVTVMIWVTMVTVRVMSPLMCHPWRDMRDMMYYGLMSSGPRPIWKSRLLRWQLVLCVMLAWEPSGLRLGGGGGLRGLYNIS